MKDALKMSDLPGKHSITLAATWGPPQQGQIS